MNLFFARGDADRTGGLNAVSAQDKCQRGTLNLGPDFWCVASGMSQVHRA